MNYLSESLLTSWVPKLESNLSSLMLSNFQLKIHSYSKFVLWLEYSIYVAVHKSRLSYLFITKYYYLNNIALSLLIRESIMIIGRIIIMSHIIRVIFYRQIKPLSLLASNYYDCVAPHYTQIKEETMQKSDDLWQKLLSTGFPLIILSHP